MEAAPFCLCAEQCTGGAPKLPAPLNIHVSLPQHHATPHTLQALDDAASISHVDPYVVVQPEVKAISERLRHSVSSTVPALKQAAEYFFRKGVEGKRLRPTLVMLMASALAGVCV